MGYADVPAARHMRGHGRSIGSVRAAATPLTAPEPGPRPVRRAENEPPPKSAASQSLRPDPRYRLKKRTALVIFITVALAGPALILLLILLG